MKRQVLYRPVRPEEYVLIYRGREIADVLWVRELKHPTLAMQRIVDGLNGAFDDREVPGRTWTLRVWEPLSSLTPTGEHKPRWLLCHNGLEVGEIGWRGPVVNADRHRARIEAGLNVDLGDKRPFPEPVRPRAVEVGQIAKPRRVA